MTGDSIKTKIVKRVLELCEPLKTQLKFRKIERKRTFFLLEAVKPALHLIFGPETMIGEDNRGYTMEFPLTFKIIVDDARDPYAVADDAQAWLQEQIESDLQLSQLANSIVYEGDNPYTDEELKPDGGILVIYIVQYRRERAKPGVSY